MDIMWSCFTTHQKSSSKQPSQPVTPCCWWFCWRPFIFCFWGSHDGEQWSVYTVTFWGFFYIVVLLVLEFIHGLRNQVHDRKVCLIGNGFMIIFVALCLFVLMKQHQFMMLQSHDVHFNYVQAKNQTPTQTTRNQFQSDWKERYCQRIKARNQYPEFNRQRF